MIAIASRWLCTVWRARPSAAAARETSSWPPLWLRTYSRRALKRLTSRKPKSRWTSRAKNESSHSRKNDGLFDSASRACGSPPWKSRFCSVAPNASSSPRAPARGGHFSCGRSACRGASGSRPGSTARREDPEPREEVRADLQNAGRVLQLVDLVENDDGLASGAKEDGRISDHLLGDRQVAVA